MKYGALLIDPPWKFRTFSGVKSVPCRSRKDPYQTMSLPELKALDIMAYALPDTALFLWATDTHLSQAIDLATHWGFKYKTIAFIWDKGRIGMGYWTRKQAEACLLFTVGAPSRKSKAVQQIIRAQRREHSRKPDEIYPRIEALVKGPYMELFARQKFPGWDQMGDETEKFHARPAAA